MAKLALVEGWTRPTIFTGTPPAVAPEQLILFPRKAVIEFPPPEGRDIMAEAIADNGIRYYLKLDRGDIPTRANEWLCHRLANLAGIPTPRCEFIQTMDGDIAFGSEAVADVFSKTETVFS